MVAAHRAIKRIYIIEDDLSAAMVIRETIELEGDPSWQVSILTDGIQAIEAIQRRKPDLVLLDLRMPGVDGSAVFRYLREARATAHLPVIFISGATAHELHDSGIEDGVLLRKPVNLTILMHVVRTHLA